MRPLLRALIKGNVVALFSTTAASFALFAVVAEENPFNFLCLLYPLSFALMSMHGRCAEVIHVARTLPLNRRTIATDAWIVIVLVFPLAAAVGFFLSTLTPFSPITLVDVPLVTTAFLAMCGSVCLAVTCLKQLAVSVESMDGTRVALLIVGGVAGLLVPAVLFVHAPLKWAMLNAYSVAGVLTGLLLTVASFRRRHWLFEKRMVKSAKKASAAAGDPQGIVFSSRLWSNIRIYVRTAILLMFGSILLSAYALLRSDTRITGLADADEVALLVTLCQFFPLGVILPLGASSLSVDHLPLRALRSLPLSPSRIALRLSGLCAVVYLGVAAGISPCLCLLSWPHVGVAISALWASFGVCLLLCAASAISRRTYGFHVSALALAFVVTLYTDLVTRSGIYTLLMSWRALTVAGAVLALLGSIELYAAITRSSTAYRPRPLGTSTM